MEALTSLPCLRGRDTWALLFKCSRIIAKRNSCLQIQRYRVVAPANAWFSVTFAIFKSLGNSLRSPLRTFSVLRTSSGFRRDDEPLSISADAGYTGVDKRVSASKVKYGYIAAKRGTLKAMPEGARKEATRYVEYLKAAARTKVDHGPAALRAKRYLISARSRQIDGPRHLLLHGAAVLPAGTGENVQWHECPCGTSTSSETECFLSVSIPHASP